MTLTELIDRLHELRAEHGGDTPVVMWEMEEWTRIDSVNAAEVHFWSGMQGWKNQICVKID